MADVLQAIMIDLLSHLTAWAMGHNQVVGPDDEYYITLTQLDAVIKQLLESYGRRIIN